MTYCDCPSCATALVLAFVVGCHTTAPTASETRTYLITGTVTGWDRAKPSVRLDHDDIPGFMEAMDMSFDLSDASLLEGLKTGDRVRGVLKVREDKSVITELEKIP